MKLSLATRYNRLFYRMELSFVLSLAEQGKKLLDIGCGDKRFTEHLPNAVGMDNRRVWHGTVNRPDQIADATSLPFPDETFDSVHAHSVFEHVPELDKAIQECYRVLKPNGSLVVLSPHNLQFAIARILTLNIQGLLEDKEHFHSLHGKNILRYTRRMFRLEKLAFMPNRLFPLFTGVRLRKV